MELLALFTGIHSLYQYGLQAEVYSNRIIKLYNVMATKKFKNDYAILRRKRFYCQYFFELEM